MVRCGESRQGLSWCGSRGEFWLGGVWHVLAVQGAVAQGVARPGEAGEANVMTQLVKARDPMSCLGRRQAEACLSQLRDVQEQHSGILTPTAVVDAARPVDAPLHPCFEWNDTIAAERFRQEQAKVLIRSVRVLFVPDDKSGRAQPTNVYIGIEGGRKFISSPTVAPKSGLSVDLKTEFVRELDVLFQKYGSVPELARVIHEMRQRLAPAPRQLSPQGEYDKVRAAAVLRQLVERAIQGAGTASAVVIHKLVNEAGHQEHVQFAFETVSEEIGRLVSGGSVGVSHVGLERTYRWKNATVPAVVNGHAREVPMGTALVPTKTMLIKFDQLHKEKLHSPAHMSPGKDARLLSDLYRRHGESVYELMQMFFETDSEFVRSAGYTVGVFYSQVGKLLTLKAERDGQLPERVSEQRGRPSVTEQNLRGLREDLRGLKR